MHPYGVRDVERLVGLSRNSIRSLVGAGFVKPTRGARNSWLFSFQDLIVLRTAHALVEARVPQRRITRSLKQLRAQLPSTMPLSGLSVGAVGDHVVVKEGAARWEAESGQYILAFEAVEMPSRGSFPESSSRTLQSQQRSGIQSPYDQAVALEEADPEQAIALYQAIIASDPSHLDARINLGRLLHEARRFSEAEKMYREALKLAADDALLHFNLGVLYQDTNRPTQAIVSYEAALALDEELADGHYNLALVYRKLGRAREALRHMARYRKLAG